MKEMKGLQPPPFKRYHDLTPDDLNVEYQVHTNQTDGQGTIDEILSTARNKQLSAIAFTEHVRRDTDWFSGFALAVQNAANQSSDLTIYTGCEAKALDKNGDLDVTSEIRQQCHLVLGSVHRFPNDGGGYIDWKQLDDDLFAKIEFELALGLVKAAPIQVLAHPGGMYQRQRHKPFPEEYLRRLMEASLERGIAYEINASYILDLPTSLQLCAEINPYISIGSDAHKLEEIGRCRDILRLAKEGQQ
jgi:putative hydrolase